MIRMVFYEFYRDLNGIMMVFFYGFYRDLNLMMRVYYGLLYGL